MVKSRIFDRGGQKCWHTSVSPSMGPLKTARTPTAGTLFGDLDNDRYGLDIHLSLHVYEYTVYVYVYVNAYVYGMYV